MSAKPPAPISSNLKFVLGIFIMLCGWIICFDIFILIIGIPFFLIGVLLVFLSKKSLLVKSITVALPIIAWFICFEIILYQINKPTSITILIPENYVGEFRIVEGEANGSSPTVENGRTTIEIPDNGILVTKAHMNLHEATTDFQYYFENKNGGRTKLNVGKVEKKNNVKFPAVVYNGLMSPISESASASNIPRKLDYVFDSFTVYDANGKSILPMVNEKDSTMVVREMINDAMTDSLVKIERGIK